MCASRHAAGEGGVHHLGVKNIRHEAGVRLDCSKSKIFDTVEGAAQALLLLDAERPLGMKKILIAMFSVVFAGEAVSAQHAGGPDSAETMVSIRQNDFALCGQPF